MNRLVVLVVVSLGILGCGFPKPDVLDNRGDYPSMWLDPTNCSVHSKDQNAKVMLASLAALANNTYLPLTVERVCRDPNAAKPEECVGFVSPGDSWEILAGNGEDSPTGLGYRIYGRDIGSERPIVVFAFRGTQFWSGLDWRSNFYLRTKKAPPQHREASQAVAAWIAATHPGWRSSGGTPKEEVYATGHSLGGAVAQYIAYTVPRVTAVVFNPSPRTGFGSIAADAYRNPAVCRMRESYEAVYTLVGGPVPVTKPGMHSCGYVNQKSLGIFLPASIVSAHSIRGMADALACYAQSPPLSPECETVVKQRKERAMPGRPCLDL